MATEQTNEPGVLETDAVLVRTMRENDLEAVVTIDAMATGRRRPRTGRTAAPIPARPRGTPGSCSSVSGHP